MLECGLSLLQTPLERTLLLTQIAFYLVTGVVVILTYLSARDSLLNPVHTEYQKLVMNKLKEVSDELGSEFDPNSPNYWAKKQSPVEEAVDQINRWVQEEPLSPLARGSFTPASSDEMRLLSLAESIKSDPFIPRHIRERVVKYLEERRRAVGEVSSSTFLEYKQDLLKGKHLDNIDSNWSWVHNLVLERLRERGWHLEQAEEEVNKIRSEIQDYFESFGPSSGLNRKLKEPPS